MRRFLVATLPSGGAVALAPAEAHHLLRVLRVARGEVVTVFDGEGREATAVLADVVDGAPVLELREPPRQAPPPPRLHLLLALLKGGAMDDAVRMATEAGATDIHPLQCARSIARGEREGRWERIAVAAAKQCHRPSLPRLHPLASFTAGLDALPVGTDLRIALPGAPPLPRATADAAILVGPEGGFTEAEIERALSAGARPTGLARFVLRAETAAAVAVAATIPLP